MHWFVNKQKGIAKTMDGGNKDYDYKWMTLVKHFHSLLEITGQGAKLEKLNEAQRVFWLVFAFRAEVNNGGFNQYFLNSSGNFANETVAALVEIRAEQSASILHRAISTWPKKVVPITNEEREKMFFEIEEQADHVWHDCTWQFYSQYEDTLELLFEYTVKQDDSFQ